MVRFAAGRSPAIVITQGRTRMIIVRRSVRRSPLSVQREMERVFSSWVPQVTAMQFVNSRSWRPSLEVVESDSELVVTAELAGIDQSSLDVTVDGDVLTIAGNRPGNREMPSCSYREAGIAYGEFSAEVYIPDQVVVDEANATYRDGMLSIRIPKAAPVPSSPKRIALSNTAE
jgi:HSP20 family protein